MINASSPRTPHQLASPVYRCRTNKGLRPTGWKTVVMIPICLQAVILLLGDPLDLNSSGPAADIESHADVWWRDFLEGHV